jgi:hypothetical protein
VIKTFWGKIPPVVGGTTLKSQRPTQARAPEVDRGEPTLVVGVLPELVVDLRGVVRAERRADGGHLARARAVAVEAVLLRARTTRRLLVLQLPIHDRFAQRHARQFQAHQAVSAAAGSVRHTCQAVGAAMTVRLLFLHAVIGFSPDGVNVWFCAHRAG